MSALLDKMNSLPQANSVDIAATDEGKTNDKPIEEVIITADPVKDVVIAEEKEPEAKTPQEKNVSEYKQRKIKAADEKAAKESQRAEKAEQELKAVRESEQEWKRQAQRVAEQRQTATPETKKVEQIDITKDPVGYLDKRISEVNARYQAMEQQQTVNAAQNELRGLEDTFSKTTTDYGEVMKGFEDATIAKMKVFNPNINESYAREQFQKDKVTAAVQFLAQGRDPIKGIYEAARAGYAYVPKKVEAVADTSKADAERAKFDAVNKNKSKSASGLSAGGSAGETELRGPETTKGRKLSDFARLTKAQKEVDYR